MIHIAYRKNPRKEIRNLLPQEKRNFVLRSQSLAGVNQCPPLTSLLGDLSHYVFVFACVIAEVKRRQLFVSKLLIL